MGWLYMRSLAGHATPKAYLDAQFTYDRDTGNSRVLASSLVGRRTYYAAVEWITAGSGEREVWGLVCLVRYNPRDREGLVFGYKDMSESIGAVRVRVSGADPRSAHRDRQHLRPGLAVAVPRPAVGTVGARRIDFGISWCCVCVFG